jgi:hypothetical protein
MSGNWANFGDFSSAAGAKQTSSGGTDDGWADFGGFEVRPRGLRPQLTCYCWCFIYQAAAPAPTSQQSQATTPSSTPSWTAFGQQSAGVLITWYASLCYIVVWNTSSQCLCVVLKTDRFWRNFCCKLVFWVWLKSQYKVNCWPVLMFRNLTVV